MVSYSQAILKAPNLYYCKFCLKSFKFKNQGNVAAHVIVMHSKQRIK